MGLCWRWSPFFAMVALVGHVTSWFGLASSVPSSAKQALSGVDGLLSGANSLISMVFAWIFVVFALELVCSVFGFVVAEIKLRRLYDRPSTPRRWPRGT
jgi:hypothetical protein